ncbi:hypothetical protein J14TS2_45280 [Bacillus sp. J14TS2]|uniref:replication-relaxation family protein n=1 Tax=Bacillus sp. J14TS2 TaxID=2807188 RepID=UPI001B24E887|nr:replication-relaxation family protein [Bacillus sp. J14TS2]GIN74053.1 hypothetical protein J14TS2_45280 [Bacillus sp. J14TS2]
MNRTEMILTLIDRLGVVSVRQLHDILKLGTYRNTCRVINQLSTYLNVVRSKEKIVYLNKEGRELIASNNEVKKSILFDHMLLANEAYIYFNCPIDWKREQITEVIKEPEYSFRIQVKGLKQAVESKKIISDSIFTRNGYVHLIEIDNTRQMSDNLKKIKNYESMWDDIKQKYKLQPILYFFTVSENRKRKLARACKSLRAEVLSFSEIK